jgi:exosortase
MALDKMAPPVAASPPSDRTAVRLWLVAALALLAVLYAPLLWRLAVLWLDDPNYSHGFLVPLISGWLAWRHIRKVGPPVCGEPGLGCLEVLSGCAVHLVAFVIAWPPLDFVALALVLRGLAVAAGGREWAKGFTFAILFLFFMFPLPVTWTGTAALWLQDWVSRASEAVLNLFVVCYRRGNALYLAGVPDPLMVAEECSGLRQIVGFVALGALLGHLGRRPPLFRVLLVVLAVPVAIAANVARVLLMAVVTTFLGTGWLSTWLHHAPALVALPLGLALFLLTGRALGRFWPPRPKEVAPCASAGA